MILSDSTDADAWIRETLSVDRLRKALLSTMPVWYRRRWQNIARKSGNLEDFVTRWGGRYDHMIVLDADSLIDAPTLQRLVQAMRSDPDLGILQTAPQLIGATTLFGRLQQFAACVYGPVITRGLVRLVRRQRQLLGAQRHHPRRRVRAKLRPAQALGPQALRRFRAVA